jgi:disulfide bond formation protein DsbB
LYGRDARVPPAPPSTIGEPLTDTIDTLLAALGVLGQVAIVAILVAGAAACASRRVRDGLLASWRALQAQALWAAWVVATVATGGSLYFSEIADYVPCQLCWYQRICMYPLATTLLVGAVLRDRRAALYSIAFPVVGALVAIRHVYIEINPDAEGASCRIGAPCSTKWIEEFGYVTIPVLALTGFVLIGLLLAVAWVAGRRGERAARH